MEQNNNNQINNEQINKYGNGKIYKIVDNTNNNIYIGSTTKTIEQRLLAHKYDYKRYLNGKYPFITSFKILKNNNYSIELIELYPCNNKNELINRESWYIRNLECVNKKIEGRTEEEKKDYMIQYFIDHKEELNFKCNERNKKKYTCECGKETTIGHKTRHEKSKYHINFIRLNNPQE